MILKLNHLNQKATAATSALIEAVYGMVNEGHIEKGQFARLQFELDWIQYKQNFRETVTATLGYQPRCDVPPPIMDIHVDTRQVKPETLRADLARALRVAESETAADRIPLFLPLHHIHGIINVTSCALWSGALVEPFARFDAAAILARAGYPAWFRYQKYREEFRAPEVVIAVDETPVGVFVEIEGGEDAIHATAHALGKSATDYITDSYRFLFLQHRDQHGLNDHHMVFAGATGSKPSRSLDE